jgi:hypothetical protein
MPVAEVRCQDRKLALDVSAGAMPAQQGTDGKAVAEIVDARAVAIGWTAQADLVREPDKRPSHTPLRKPRPPIREKEARGAW